MRNKEFIGHPIPEKNMKEKKGDKLRNLSPNQKEPENHDGIQSFSERKDKKK